MHTCKPTKIISLLVLVVVLTLMFTCVAAQPGDLAAQPGASYDENYSGFMPVCPDIDAPSAILIEYERGQVLCEKNAGERLHISAACKIMTSIIVIEKANMDAKVTISKESAEAEGSILFLEAGEKYTVENLLYAIMLGSYNDAANALAEFVGGDIKTFVNYMNNKVSELNLMDTHFTNPTGLFHEAQYTTAYDTAMIVKYALNNPEFNRIFSTQIKPLVSNNGTTKILKNQNKLFWSYDGVNGGKTGFNEKDKQTAITTASKGFQKLICVVLDTPESNLFTDSETLLNYGFNNFRRGILIQIGSPQKSIIIQEQEINLISINNIYYSHPVGENYVKNLNYDIAENLEPPIKKDRIIGTARYVLFDDTVIDINLYPDREINLPETVYSSLTKTFLENSFSLMKYSKNGKGIIIKLMI